MTRIAADRLAAVRELLGAGDVLVLTGAGISTDSGIPDYRGPTGQARRHAPMTYQNFVADSAARRRYWARGFLGWRPIAQARPNSGHLAVARLQAVGAIGAVVTQNVDGLHQRAGARDVIELHGGLDRTVCLGCGSRRPRTELDERLARLNPRFAERAGTLNPDGDVELSEADLAGFVPAHCLGCGADLLKPDVVFFGESVPRDRVEQVFALVEQSPGILVLGSSLTVFSGYRFVRAAARAGRPVAIVNLGSTRADDLATIRVDAPLGAVLPELAGALAP